MKLKRTFAVLIASVFISSVGVAFIAASADVGDTDTNWTVVSGTVTAVVAEDDYTTVSHSSGYGSRAYYNTLVAFDGLEIDYVPTTLNSYQGVYFSTNTSNGYYGATSAPFALTLSSSYVLGAVSNNVATNTSLVYTSPDCTTLGFSDSSATLALTADGEGKLGMNYKFSSYDDDVWQLTVTMIYGTMDTSAANYDSVAGSCTVYIPKTTMEAALDANGDTYVFSGGTTTTVHNIKITEAAEEVETCAYSGMTDGDWVNAYSSGTAAFADNGYTEIGNITSWGQRMYYKYKVQFDGLDLSMRVSGGTNGTFLGFYFSSSVEGYFQDEYTPLGITYWAALYGSGAQDRVAISKDHNYSNANCVVYTDPDCTTVGFSVASNLVSTHADTVGYNFKISSYDEDVYAIKITMTDNAGIWASNANYDSTDMSCTVYLPKSYMEDYLDENGDIYLFVGSNSTSYTMWQVSVSDANYSEYAATNAVSVATEAVEAYEEAVGNITDYDTFETAMGLKTTAVSALTSLRSADAAALTLRLEEQTDIILADADMQTILYNAINEKLDAAYDAYTEFVDDNSTITSTALAAAQALRSDAKSDLSAYAAYISDTNYATLETLAEEVDHLNYYSIVLLWVVDYEAMGSNLSSSSATLADDIIEAKEYRVDYENSTAYTIMTTSGYLTTAEIEAFDARIEAVDELVSEFETEVIPELMDNYLSLMEETLDLDLTIKTNIETAKTAYETISLYVTITDTDGTYWTRYQAGYNAIKTACEDYILAELSAVETLIAADYDSVIDFMPVAARYNAIDLDFLMETSTTVEDEYDRVFALIEATTYYYFTISNSSETEIAEQNDTGIVFSATPTWGTRINYNKGLDFEDGVEVVLELTSAAYYNDGSKANNIFISFTENPDSSKNINSTSGITIGLWLFSAETKVHIYNTDDTSLASATIATPMDGETISISIKYQQYYSFVENDYYWAYVITVNEAEIVLTYSQLTVNGYGVPETAYFSLYSCCDDTSTNNIITIVSINDVSFGASSSSSGSGSSGSGSGDSGSSGSGSADSGSTDSGTADSGTSDEEESGGLSAGAIAGIVIGSVAGAGIIVTGGVILIRRRRRK